MTERRTIKRMYKPELLELVQSIFDDIKKIHEFFGEIDHICEKAKSSDIAIHKTLEENGTDGYLKRIEKAASNAEQKFKKIEEAYLTICEDGEEEGEESIKTQLDALVEAFEEDKKKIDQFKREIWGFKKKNDAGEIEKIDGIFDTINAFHEKQKEKYDTLYGKIETELLSGATAVNLAKVFETKVREYKFWGNFWGALFIILLLGLTAYYGAITFFTEEVNTLEDIWLHLLFRAPFLIFGVWLSMFFGNRRAENKKLEESYKHKEVMARSFTGYKEAIKDLDNEDQELLKIHMNNLLNTMNQDSGDFLDHKGENHPLHDFIKDKFSIKKKESKNPTKL